TKPDMATRKDAMRIMRECLDFLFGVDRSEKVLQSTMRNAAFLNRLEKNCRPQLDIFADIVSAYRDNHILLSIGELTRRLLNELRSLPLPEGDDSADSSQYIFHSQQAIIERVPAPIGKCSVSNDFIRIVQAKPPVDYIDPPSLGDGNDNADQPEEPDPEEFIETMAGEEEEEEVIEEHNSILFDDNDKGEANELDDADIESLAESDDATRKRSVSTEAIRIALKTERLRRRSTPSSTGASSAVSSRSGQSPADVQQPRRAQLNLPVPVDLNDAEIAVSLPAEQQHQNQLRDSEPGIRLSKSFSLSPAFGNVFSDNDFDDLDFGSPQFEPGAPLAATAADGGSKLSRLRLQQQEEQQQQQEAETRRREAEQERVKAEKDAERIRQEAELEEKRKKEAVEFEARQQKANDREKRKAEKEVERKKKEAKLEAKRKQKEAELEAERERKEAERRQKEAELEAERERKEAELEAERERKEAERRHKEAELEAERERQEAERKQKEELEAERERQEAERRKEKELEAEQERREAERKQKEELEAERERQEAERRKEKELEAEQERREAERKQKEDELEAKRRQKEVELEAKRRQKEVELEAKREKKEAKLRRQKAELEAEQERQETERKEKENKLKADRKNNKAELEAEQESKYAKKQRVVRNSRRNRVDDDELEAEQKETSSKPIPGRKGRQLRSKPEIKNDAKAANAETKSCARKRRAPEEPGFLGSLRRKHKVDLDAETSNASSEEGDESNSEQLNDGAVSEPDSDRQRPPTPQPGASKSQRCSSRQGRLSSPPQSPTFFTADVAATAAAPDEFAELDRLVRERGRCLFDEEVHDDKEVPEAVVEDKASAPELVIELQQPSDEAKEALVPPVSNNKSKKQLEKKPETEDNNNRPARRAAAQRANVSLSAMSMSQAIDQFNAGLGLGVAGDEHNEKCRRPAPTMLSKKSKITKTTRQPESQEDKEEQQQQQPPQESALDADKSASPVWRFNDAQSSTSPRKFFSTTFADRRRSEAKRLLTAKEQFGYKLYHLNRPANPSFNAVLKPTHNLTDPVMSKVAGQKSRKRKPQHKNSVTFCAEEDEEEADLFAEVRPRKTARQTQQRQQQTPKMRKQLDYLTMMQEDNDADADEDRRMLMNIEDDDDEVDNVDRGRRPRQSRFAGLPKPDAGTLFRMVRFRRKLVNLLDQLAAEYPQVAEAIGQIEKGEVRSVDEVVL
ncbi:hypothetical protein BOX15_Mlig004608g4, partial [Macrostomum lignano]